MRRLGSVLIILLALVNAAPGQLLPAPVYFKGRVTHILENPDGQDNAQRLVKVRLVKNSAKDFIFIEMPEDQRLKTGDYILVRKIDDNYNYGLDSTFEEKFIFADYARDRAVWLPLLALGLGLLLLSKKTAAHLLVILGVIFLLLGVLPFWLERQWPLSLFTLFFCLSSGLSARWLLPLSKPLPALGAALLGSTLGGLGYAGLIKVFRLTPFKQLAQNLPAFGNIPEYLDAHILVMFSFYLCLFALVFLARVSSRRSLLDNIRLLFFKTVQLFLLIGAGLLLPCILFFQLNNLSLLELFNYPPFVYLAEKLLFGLLSIQLGCLFYLFYYYARHKQDFDRQAELAALKAAPAEKPSLRKILQKHQQAKPPLR